MSEHEFQTTYRGAEVPGWISGAHDGEGGYEGDDIRQAFKEGVDSVLVRRRTPVVEENTPSEPDRRFAYKDADGDIWRYDPV